ncbi:MAG: hypothetical protein KGM43_08080 [Planctomycetota bacterium]|nr:hypothetical protein [Planctomycetota bacterium]
MRKTGGIKVWRSSPATDWMFCHTAMKAFIRPAWYRCLQNGWELERFRAILDSSYDSMGLNDKERFWKRDPPSALSS